jgi:hypothetical protein
MRLYFLSQANQQDILSLIASLTDLLGALAKKPSKCNTSMQAI